jgi:Ca-activated chloride channel family protein
MTFRSGQILALLAVIPFAVLALAARERLREQIARRFASERLRGVAVTTRAMRPWLISGGLLLALLALAGPSRGFTSVPITDREANRIVALDVSNSMLAEDVGTRLTAAKAIARRLIEAHPGRVALIEFEAAPEVVSPLTSDNDAVVSLLDSIEAGDVGQPGSDIGAALAGAIRVADGEPNAKADVVIISDGEDQGTRLSQAIAQARQRGIAISTVLVGTGQGSTIPTPSGELRNDAGEVVTTYAHAETLQNVASATGGTFVENPFTEKALDAVLFARGRGAASQRNVRIPIDRFQWPLSAAFAALLLGSVANRGAE